MSLSKVFIRWEVRATVLLWLSYLGHAIFGTGTNQEVFHSSGTLSRRRLRLNMCRTTWHKVWENKIDIRTLEFTLAVFVHLNLTIFPQSTNMLFTWIRWSVNWPWCECEWFSVLDSVIPAISWRPVHGGPRPCPLTAAIDSSRPLRPKCGQNKYRKWMEIDSYHQIYNANVSKCTGRTEKEVE